MPAITVPTRTGYTFLGYFDTRSGGNQYYTATGISAKNWDKAQATTLYAHWSAKELELSFDVASGLTATGNAISGLVFSKDAQNVATIKAQNGTGSYSYQIEYMEGALGDLTIDRETGLVQTKAKLNAGTYTLTIKVSDQNSNVTKTITIDVTVAKKNVTVTWSNTSLTYNGQTQIPTAKYTDVDDNEITVADNKIVVAVEHKNADTYTAKVADDTNYNFENTTEYTIARKAITVDWAGLNFVYNKQGQYPTPTAQGVISGETVVLDVDNKNNINVNNYSVSAVLDETTYKNYKLEQTEPTRTTSYNIIKKTVSVEPYMHQSKVYGDAEPELIAFATGVETGDTINYTVTREEGKNVGTYAITIVPGDNLNYELTVKSGTFTIDKKVATITANNATKIYGALEPTSSTQRRWQKHKSSDNSRLS